MSTPEERFVPVVEGVKWEWTTESRISTVIGLLPTSLQSRMGPFRPFRRSVSLGNLRTGEFAGARNRAKQRPVSMGGAAMLPDDNAGTGKRHDKPRSDSSEMAIVSRNLSPRGTETGSISGINWRFAHQGANLIGIAADAGADEHSEAFERKAYLDGMTYLLKSLPPDMDNHEINQIKAVLPVQLGPNDPPSNRPGAATPDPARGLPKSIVHRLVQAIVLNLFLLIHLMLPYLIIMLKSAASVERKYKVSEAIIGHGVSCCNAMGRYCARVAEAALTASDGKVGKGVSSSFAWTVEEVTRGISDGLGAGLVVTRWKDATAESQPP